MNASDVLLGHSSFRHVFMTVHMNSHQYPMHKIHVAVRGNENTGKGGDLLSKNIFTFQ